MQDAFGDGLGERLHDGTQLGFRRAEILVVDRLAQLTHRMTHPGADGAVTLGTLQRLAMPLDGRFVTLGHAQFLLLAERRIASVAHQPSQPPQLVPSPQGLNFSKPSKPHL